MRNACASGAHRPRAQAKINLKSVFDRKNYFYPDLPPGYQISQYKSPIVGEGEIVVDMPDGETIRVGIERLHLEQDAGKSVHDQNPTLSLVDLNRAGVALMEIVSKPDLRAARTPRPTSLNFARFCVTSVPAMAIWKGQSARRRQRFSAQTERAARHALRDKKRQFDPFHRPSDRARGAPADRPHRGRWSDRAGDAVVRPGHGRDTFHAFKEEARLPLLSRSRPITLELSPALVADLQKNLPELPDEKKSRSCGIRALGLPGRRASRG